MTNQPTLWYVLNHIAQRRSDAQRDIDAYNRSAGAGLELFAPTYLVAQRQGGRTVMRPAPLMYHYVFVRGTLSHIKALCARHNGYSFVLDRCGADRYATLGDDAMHGLRVIAAAYTNALPYYPLDSVDLERGDTVEVVNGDFPGLVGTYLPRRGSSRGNIILRVDATWGAAALDIHADDIRILRFAPGTTRLNDHLDAISPAIAEAEALLAAGLPLPAPLRARLSLFRRRHAAAQAPTPRLAARLTATLTRLTPLLLP